MSMKKKVRKKIVGDLSNTERVLVGLDVRPHTQDGEKIMKIIFGLDLKTKTE